MNRIAAVLAGIILVAAASPAFAGQDDVTAGFRIGKFYVSTSVLAMDLDIIASFAENFRMDEITDENYQAGVITDDDLEGAKLALAYTLWRVQLAVIPLCEAGLEDGTLDPEIYGDLAESTKLVLTDLKNSANKCLEGQDFAAVAQFASDIYEYGFVEDLQWLSDQAEDLANGGYLAGMEAPADDMESDD